MTDSSGLLTAVPPLGHILCNDRWRNSSLVQSLKDGGLRILFEAELGLADFRLPNRSCVLYVSECDVVSGCSYRRKLVRYRNTSNSFQQLVLVELTGLSRQFFSAVQSFVVFDLGLAMLPLSGQTEAAQLLAQMVQGGGRDNPFRRRSASGPAEPLVLAAVQRVPGVGRVKALALLQRFCSLQRLSAASCAELEPLVGPAAAQQIHSFFHRTSSAAGT